MHIGLVASTRSEKNKKPAIRELTLCGFFFSIENTYTTGKVGKGKKMSDFKAIETQEQLDAVIGERLKRERETNVKKYEGYLSPEDFKTKTADYETKIGDLTKELNESNKKLADRDKEIAERDTKIRTYETASVKSRIAHEVGLSYDAIDFLKGEDEDSIRKSAESLKALVGSKQAAPLANVEDSSGVDKDAALRKTLKSLKGEE